MGAGTVHSRVHTQFCIHILHLWPAVLYLSGPCDWTPCLSQKPCSVLNRSKSRRSYPIFWSSLLKLLLGLSLMMFCSGQLRKYDVHLTTESCTYGPSKPHSPLYCIVDVALNITSACMLHIHFRVVMQLVSLLKIVWYFIYFLFPWGLGLAHFWNSWISIQKKKCILICFLLLVFLSERSTLFPFGLVFLLSSEVQFLEFKGKKLH